MQVRLGNMGDPDVRLGRRGLHPVRVPLRIDDQGHTAVVDHVAAVAERPGFNDNNLHKVIVPARIPTWPVIA
ncbi:hypothetical protein GCM10009712_09980 [Pseudarthrobacter sulfonivorans]